MQCCEGCGVRVKSFFITMLKFRPNNIITGGKHISYGKCQFGEDHNVYLLFESLESVLIHHFFVVSLSEHCTLE